jgi:Tfp pilus assembly protein PilF
MPNRRFLTALAVFAGLAALAYAETAVLGLPWYAVALTYAAVAVSAALLSYKSLIAAWGNALYQNGDETRAARAFDLAIAKGSKSAAAHLSRAVIHLRRGDAQAALALLDKAESLKPNLLAQKNIAVSRGSCYWVMGDIPRAIEIMEDMRARFEYVNANVLTTLGYLYILREDYEKARELTELALEEAEESYAAWDNMGQIHYREGEPEKAKEAFARALSIKSGYVDSLFFSGLIAEEEGDKTGAAEFFKRAAAADVTALNAVTPDMIGEKYSLYFGEARND